MLVSEGWKSCDASSNNESVDIMSSLVCVDSLQVHNMADNVVLNQINCRTNIWLVDNLTSSLIPFPPNMSRQSLAMARALPQLFLFRILIISGTSWNNQSEISIVCCQPIRDKYWHVSTNERWVLTCVNQWEMSILTWPSSLSLPSWRQEWRPRLISVTASASFFWISWLAARGRPNCFLLMV